MKRMFFATLLLLTALVPPAEAACVTHTYYIDGRVMMCTTCCYGTVCTTTCT